MDLTPIEILHSSFSLVAIVISILIGLIIISKYFKFKQRNFLLIGIFWTGLTFPWLPTVITFIMVLTVDYGLPVQGYILIGIMILPLTVLCGLTAFTSLLGVKRKRRRAILLSVLVFNLVYESLIIYFLITNVNIIATLAGVLTIQWSVFSQIYFIINLVLFLVTGILFSRKSLQAESKEIRFKGKLLMAAFISFTVGTILDFAIPNPITYIIARLILLSSSIEFYIGFLLPERIKRLLIKE
jgi:hypothetical protein